MCHNGGGDATLSASRKEMEKLRLHAASWDSGYVMGVIEGDLEGVGWEPKCQHGSAKGTEVPE
jgi:hypothetical protein